MFRSLARVLPGLGAFLRMLLGPRKSGGEIANRILRSERDSRIPEHFARGRAIVVNDRLAHTELVEEYEARGFDGGRHDESASVLAQFDIRIGEAQTGEYHPVGRERIEFAPVGMLVGITADEDKRQRVGGFAVGFEEKLRFVLRRESRDVEKIPVRLEVPARKFTAVHRFIAHSQPIGEMFRPHSVFPLIAIHDGGIVGDDDVRGFCRPLFAALQPRPREAAPFFATEVRAVDIDDNFHARGTGNVSENGITHATEINNVIATPYGVYHG